MSRAREGNILFTPKKLGPLQIPNRFMRSATWEKLADEQGRPKEELITMMDTLANGGIGLIVPGSMYTSKKGQNCLGEAGMCTVEQARMWRRAVTKMHSHGSKVVFQLIHGGAFADPTINGGYEPMCPTSFAKDQKEMTNADIEDVIQEFCDAAELTAQTGADGIQIHAAHGYLISEFLSPAYNKRKDKWGGSTENRLRIVGEIVEQVKKICGEGFAITMKMNGNDHVKGGVLPLLAAEYVHILGNKIDLYEISCGFSMKYVIRSDVEDAVLSRGLKNKKRRELVQQAHEMMDGAPFYQMYNRDALKVIRNKNPHANLALVGGNRSYEAMSKLVKSGEADVVSMSRPFLCDPYLVHRLRAKTLDAALCVNCGSCIIDTSKGVYCHLKH